MVTVLDSISSRPSSSPDKEQCVFSGKTLHSSSASLEPGAQMHPSGGGVNIPSRFGKDPA